MPVSRLCGGQQCSTAVQDVLIDELGGPAKVAEMSGRRKRMIRNPDGAGFVYRLVAEEGVPLDQVLWWCPSEFGLKIFPCQLLDACHAKCAWLNQKPGS